ncbi:MAG TPA: NAD-dependent epimerase/dehydratase family protein, partial [Verrucomicrobiae bacterium]|nr:NAD-dependent epimerase/dehydratase family protein [Verrucomicrobiae bacterium]
PGVPAFRHRAVDFRRRLKTPELSSNTLILGATGGFGSAVAQELLRRGRPSRCLVRNLQKASTLLGKDSSLELVQGDVQDQNFVVRAAEGCGAIIHAINYPYPKWVPNMARATANVIAAARAANATILFPGNVYGLGEQFSGPLDESAHNQPTGHKGELRVTLEDSLLHAAEEEGSVRVIVLRAGDYFGPTVRNGLVDPIFGNAVDGKPLRALGNLDAAHQWAFVPDLARAALDLLAIQEGLEAYEVFNFAGYIASPEREFLEQIAEQSGHAGLSIRVLPWSALKLAAMFDATVRELMELRYLFDQSVILEGSKLRRTLPEFEETAIAEAIRVTLESYQNDPSRSDSD